MSLTPDEERELLAYIPTQPDPDPLYAVDYHESKINSALRFAPFLNRAEAWALSMYLGPTYYCQGINRTLLGMDLSTAEREKFWLMAKAAKSALEKLPSLTPEELAVLEQPDSNLPPANYLKRFVFYPEEVLQQYQVGQTRQEPTFLSTTYWQAPVGQMRQYADRANTVFHVHILAARSWGKYVNGIKRSAVEGEVLFQPNTEFLVTQRQVEDYPLDVMGTEQCRMNVIYLQEKSRDANEREV